MTHTWLAGKSSAGSAGRVRSGSYNQKGPPPGGRQPVDAPSPIPEHKDLEQAVLARELAYHEQLYAGFAQQHFAKPAVRALRAHMVERIRRVCALDRTAAVLSLGCGIGDTEILLAPHVARVEGIDLSPAAIRQARADARSAGCANCHFAQGSLETAAGEYDAVIAIFFLHHLPDQTLAGAPERIARLLRPGGWFYSLDPNRFRLSGALGSLLFPALMKKYQTPDERELDPTATCARFSRAGFAARVDYYDFASSPMAGLLPSSLAAYRLTRWLDELPRRLPLVRRLGSNFEIIARKPR